MLSSFLFVSAVLSRSLALHHLSYSMNLYFFFSLAHISVILALAFLLVLQLSLHCLFLPVSLILTLPTAASPRASQLSSSPPCHDAAVVRRGPSICQRQVLPTSTTSLPLLAIIWRLAQGPETAACTAPRLRTCSSTPAPLEDCLVPCPGCDNL